MPPPVPPVLRRLVTFPVTMALPPNGHLLVDDLDDLLTAAAPPLDCQHRISRRAYKLDS